MILFLLKLKLNYTAKVDHYLPDIRNDRRRNGLPMGTNDF